MAKPLSQLWAKKDKEPVPLVNAKVGKLKAREIAHGPFTFGECHAWRS